MKAGADNTAGTYRTGSMLRISSSSTKTTQTQPAQVRAVEEVMHCSTCRNLERAFAHRNGEYLKARAATYSRFSLRFVAYTNVEMERARSELDVHRAVCLFVSAVAGSPGSPASALIPELS